MAIQLKNLGRLATLRATLQVLRSAPRLLTISIPAVALISLANLSYAQEGRSLAVGETELTPELRLDYVSVDNTFYSATNPVESSGIILAPSLEWEASRRLLNVKAIYAGRFGSYSESILDFNDHDLRLRVEAQPKARHRGFGEFRINQSHESIGTGQAALLTDADDQVVSTDVTAQVGYVFGGLTAKGNLGAGLAIGNKSYSNVSQVTDGDDYTLFRPYAYFAYSLTPDTRFRTELRYAVRSFDDSERDRNIISLLTGFDFVATARTGGNLYFGAASASYKSADSPDETSLVSEVSMYYMPRTYSRFDFKFARNFATSEAIDLNSGSALINELDIQWTHNWTSRVKSLASFTWEDDDRLCSSRDTTFSSAGAELEYNVQRWFSVGVSFYNEDRVVGDCPTLDLRVDLDANRTTFGVFLRANL